MSVRKWFLNGGRGSGKTLRLLCETYENKIADLKKENAELKRKLTAIRKAKDRYDMSKDKSIIKAFGAEYSLFCDLERILEDWLEDDELDKAKDIILSLYNAGRDVLMCREQEEAYARLDEAINDKRIEQFLKEIE